MCAKVSLFKFYIYISTHTLPLDANISITVFLVLPWIQVFPSTPLWSVWLCELRGNRSRGSHRGGLTWCLYGAWSEEEKATNWKSRTNLFGQLEVFNQVLLSLRQLKNGLKDYEKKKRERKPSSVISFRNKQNTTNEGSLSEKVCLKKKIYI